MGVSPGDGAAVPQARYRRPLAALVPLALTAYVQYPLTRGCFRADDFLNLYQINNYSLFQYLVIPNAGHVLVARNVVFYLSWLLFGTHAWAYLWCAYLTHLLNVGLLFLVIERFTRSRSAAVVGAAIWGVCPLHAHSVGFYAVYGHVMVGTAMLLVLWMADRADRDGIEPNAATVAFWYGLALFAVTCFGTGITFAMVLPFVLALLLPRWRPAWRLGLPLVSLLAVVPLLYFGVQKVYEAAFDHQLATGAGFALMLQALPSAPLAFVRVLAFAVIRLLLSPLPTASLSPPAYALLGGLVLALALYSWRAPLDVRRRIAACVLLTLGCYGAIVAARAWRLTALPVAAMDADGRFHYAPLIPLTILLAFVWQPVSARLPRASTVLIGAWCTAVVAAFLWAAPAPDRCVALRRQVWTALVQIAAAIRRAPPGETVVLPNRRFPFTAMHVVVPGWAGLFTIWYPDNVVDGRRVVFTERDPLVLEWAQKGRRSRTLLVAPDADVPAATGRPAPARAGAAGRPP